MIYREDSIKNLMNNSIVRYNDPAVLEVSATICDKVLFWLKQAKQQMGTTVRFQFSCMCKGGRAVPKAKKDRNGKTERQKVSQHPYLSL